MPDFNITWIDYTIVGLYLVFTIGVGIWFARGERDAEGYFLAGRNFTWPLVGLSLLATNHSGASYIGLSGAGYTEGVAIFNYEWMGALFFIFFLFFFLPFYYRRAQVFTTPEFLESRFDRRSRLAFSGFLLIAAVFVDLSVTLYAGAIAIGVLFPGAPLWTIIVVLALVAGFYTILGGLAAVIVTDSIQAVMFMVGAIAISIAVFTRIDSLEQARAAAPPDAFSLIQPLSDDALPWLGLITGLLVLNVYFTCMNQVIVQRAFSARSLDHGRWGILFGAGMKLTLLFLLIIPATFGNVLYPNLENPDMIFPVIAFDGSLPIGLRGVILAALIAATMSSIDSILNALSTVVTMDFVRPARPDFSFPELKGTTIALHDIDAERLETAGMMARWTSDQLGGQIVAAAILVFAVIWAPQIARFETLFQYIQSAVGYTTPPIAVAFLLGIFWRHQPHRATATAAFVTIVTGILLGVVMFSIIQLPGLQLFQLQFLYAAAILFVLSCALMVGISLVTPPPSEEKVHNLVWSRELWREETRELEGKPWYTNYRYLSLGLIVVIAIFFVVFW